MNGIIRKISVGSNLPDGGMHYQLGSKMNLQGHVHTIVHMVQSSDLAVMGKLGYNIFVSDAKGTYLWKTLVDVPLTIEYKIDFD